MKCTKCGRQFNVTVNLTHAINMPTEDAIQINTKCEHCGARFYTFTDPNRWASEELASIFIAHHRANRSGGELN
jgi:DNA-directed RNA polymerase subunit RPC12/RpoP